MFKSKLEQIEIAYNNHKENKCYQEVNSIRNGFKPKTLLIRGKKGNIVNYKQKVLQMWSEYYEKCFELEDGMDSDNRRVDMCTNCRTIYAEPPNDVDMEMAVSKLKNEKATGHYQFLAALIKYVRKGAQEGHLQNHFKNVGGRKHTT
jgi:hypothetical protein